jgi:hypothetical protein
MVKDMFICKRISGLIMFFFGLCLETVVKLTVTNISDKMCVFYFNPKGNKNINFNKSHFFLKKNCEKCGLVFFFF